LVRRDDVAEQAILWLFVIALAWVPLYYGSNDLTAWGINAVLFPGLAAVYEVSLLIRRKSHPIGIRHLAFPAALFTAVVLWIWLQTLTWVWPSLIHPIWRMAGDALAQPIAGSISVNRDLTVLALVRLVTAASTFWVAVQLCRNGARARFLIQAITVIACFYALYGLVAFAAETGRLPWLEMPSGSGGSLSSTFINHNSFATYAGLGLVAIAGLIFQLYRHQANGMAGWRRLQLASLIEITGRNGAAPLAGGFVILAALLLTGSRGGVIAAALGLCVLAVLMQGQGGPRARVQWGWIVFALVLAAVMLFAFGDAVVDGLATRGIYDNDRLSVYLLTLRSILDAPWLGHGYGTFADVFPLYRDRSISVEGIWEQAHNTYLEVFQGLGLVFGTMLVASVLVLVLRCVKGSIARRHGATVPRVAASAAFIVGVHALVDFSLQIQAVALTFMAILGAGVAQSESSRSSLGD
jgi:O-antigen ligase